MSAFRITVLVENTAQWRGLLGEHGLALWIEVGTKRILFDTGQTELVRRNARALNIDPPAAESIVLSHGHYDHTGGLATVQGQTGRINVYLHPHALAEKYAENLDGTVRDVGMPGESRDALDACGTPIFTEHPVNVCGGFWCTGPVPRTTDYEDTGGAFFTDTQCRRPDHLVDDQAAVMDTHDGVVAVLGCAHAGLINTLRYVKELFPGRPIHTVIGGTHLTAADESRMRKTVEALREFDVQYLYPLHCTGFTAAARLWREFPDRVFPCPVATSLEFK